MADTSLARRYASALIDLGVEERCVEVIERDLHTFRDVLNLGDGMLGAALSNPGLTVDERRGILDSVLKSLTLHRYVRNLLCLLNDKGRFFIYGELCAAYTALADTLAGRLRATITTARPIGALLKAHVESALNQSTGKRVIVSYQVKPSLLGGMVAQVGDRVIDASVSARLSEIQNALLRGASAAEA